MCISLLEYKYGLRSSPPPELPDNLNPLLRTDSTEDTPPPDFEDDDYIVAAE